jgi:NAD(P)-dependent dehydrogenase (short-subunit alcohol dehydrogenase family)/acyl dehydratase
MGLLDGKVAIITGAGGGLGRTHALLLAKEGARIVVNDLGGTMDGSGSGNAMADQVVAEIIAQGGEAVANYASVCDEAGAQSMVDDALKAWGRLDILVNNAGILRDKSLLKLEPPHFDLVLEVHARGTYLCTRAAATQMKAAGNGGAIISTSSIAGLKGNFGQTNYACAKAGIAGMTRVWAMEFGRAGIRCNVIAPMAKTRMTVDIDAVPEDTKPEQISPMVLFLASDLAQDVNGRIFGCHGRHMFEYRMELTPGVELKDEEWTAARIAERLEEISQHEHEAQGVAPAAPSEGGSDQDKLNEIFRRMPEAFLPDKAGDWVADIHFDITGTGSWTVSIAGGKCTTAAGQPGDASCNIKYKSAEIMIGVATRTINPQQAFMSGKISADNMGDLMKFAQCFDMSKAGKSAAVESDVSESQAAPSTDKAQGMNKATIGKRFSSPAEFVYPAHVEAFAEATNDSNPSYVGSDKGIAPVIFPVRPLLGVCGQAALDKELNADLMRLVHGEQEMIFHSPLKPWDLITARAQITEIQDKASGQLLTIGQRLMRDGECVVEATSGYFIRGAGGGSKKKRASTEPPKRDYLFEQSWSMDEDQSIRYADASLDKNPIHIDNAIAQAAGHPRIIAHGLCTLAMSTRELVNEVAAGDPTKLKRLKVRFTKVVLPGETLRTRAWLEAQTADRQTIGFETLNAAGQVVLGNASAEFAR